MLKKIIVMGAILLGSFSTAFAGTFYAGPALKFESIKADKAGYIGITPVLHFGYSDWVREWLNLALDTTLGAQSIVIKNNEQNAIGLRPDYSYGFSLVPTIMLDETISGYARIGYLAAKFESLNTRKNGTEVGLGLDAKFAKDWSVYFEYDYTRYSRIASLGVMHSDEFTLGLNYRMEGF